MTGDTLTPEIRAACEAAIGRTREVTDSMAPEAARKLATLLGHPMEEDALPPTWHWAWFNAPIAMDRLGRDLHEELGHFLPAAPFPRRMWAAGEVEMHRPLRLGQSAHRHSEITDVAFKEGRSGAMCFATVQHEIEQAGETVLHERQTIVYRDRGAPTHGLRAPGDPVPDGYATTPEAQLFFYSAVTHNGHRIHWDRDFCRDEEGYPDLVVHGPLMATELADRMRDGLAPCRYTFRAEAPVFVTTPIRYLPGEGRIERSDGATSMSATLDPL